MATTHFERWFADLLGQSELEVKRLLGDRTATHFLIVWSIFESKCFCGIANLDKFEAFADRLALSESFDVNQIAEAVAHFHARYQDATHLRHLMHKKTSAAIKQTAAKLNILLAKPLIDLLPQEAVYLAVFIVYRFRNNIFHGNKGVTTWLQYTEQIDLCTHTMQAFVSHAEAIESSIKTERAA